MGSFNFCACRSCGQTSSAGGEILNACRMRRGKCRRVPGKGAGDWLVWGGEKAARRGKRSGDRGRRAAEPAGAELPSAAKPRCLRGQPWAPGLLSPQCWQTKSRKDRQLPAPGMNLPRSQLSAFPLFLGELSGWWGGPCLPRCLCGTYPGLEATAGEAMSSSCAPTNAISQHSASLWGRKLTFSLCRAPSVAQTHTHAAPGAALLGDAGTQARLSLSLGSGGRVEREGVSIRDA